MFWSISVGCGSSDSLVFQTLTVVFFGLLHFSVVPGAANQSLRCCLQGQKVLPCAACFLLGDLLEGGEGC